MNFYFDENLPPALARALDQLSKRDAHSVIPFADKFTVGTPDIDWINALGDNDNAVVIAQDNVHKNVLQRSALKQAGLIVFVLDRAWSKQQYWEKAANIVKWWPRIIEQSCLVSGGAVFRVPWRLSERGRFQQETF